MSLIIAILSAISMILMVNSIDFVRLISIRCFSFQVLTLKFSFKMNKFIKIFQRQVLDQL